MLPAMCKMNDTGEYYLVYAVRQWRVQNMLAKARHFMLSLQLGTATEEVSPAASNVSRLKFTITTPGTVRIIAAGVYGLYYLCFKL